MGRHCIFPTDVPQRWRLIGGKTCKVNRKIRDFSALARRPLPRPYTGPAARAQGNRGKANFPRFPSCAASRRPLNAPQTPAERCRSGRTGRSRKPLWVQAHPGFESLSLRHYTLNLLQIFDLLRFVTKIAPLWGRSCNAYFKVNRMHFRGYLPLSSAKSLGSPRGHPPNQAPCVSERPLFDGCSTNSFGNFVWVQGSRRDFPSLRSMALCPFSPDRDALFMTTGSRGAGLGRPPAGGSFETLFRRAPRVRISFAPYDALTIKPDHPMGACH